MKPEDKFVFGKYKDLKLKHVYQGTLNINRHLLKDYINFLLNTKARFHYENQFDNGALEFIDEYEITEQEIKALIYVDNKNSPIGQREVYLEEAGHNIEGGLENCLSIGNQMVGRQLGGFVSLSNFNHQQDVRQIVGADPEYLCWCIENVEFFFIPIDDIAQLEKLRISIFKGLYVVRKQGGVYEYLPKMEIKYFAFPEKVKQANQVKINNIKHQSNQKHLGPGGCGPSAYGYDSWDDMSFNEAFEGDQDAWDHYNQ